MKASAMPSSIIAVHSRVELDGNALLVGSELAESRALASLVDSPTRAYLHDGTNTISCLELPADEKGMGDRGSDAPPSADNIANLVREWAQNECVRKVFAPDCKLPAVFSTEPKLNLFKYNISFSLEVECLEDWPDLKASLDAFSEATRLMRERLLRRVGAEVRNNPIPTAESIRAIARNMTFTPGMCLPINYQSSEGYATGALLLRECRGGEQNAGTLVGLSRLGSLSSGLLSRTAIWQGKFAIQRHEAVLGRLIHATSLVE